MIIVEEWIKEPKETRTAHLKLDEPCVERGGNSTVHRGVLAEYLGTNLPDKLDLCHACGNGKCSNPRHLYWGTRKENVEDAKRHGTWKSGWVRLVEKHGEDGARKIRKQIAEGNRYGSGNREKPKSEEHKRKISLNHKGGRKKISPCNPIGRDN